MAIHVYKPGDTHEVDGLKCEIISCEIGEYAEHKAAGCVDDVKELYPELFQVSEPEEIPAEVQMDLVDVAMGGGLGSLIGDVAGSSLLGDLVRELDEAHKEAPEFLTQNIPVDKADKSKKK
jgi:hypothetical protein